MDANDFILIRAAILPPVFSAVLKAKQLLADGTASNISQAIRMVGISRSAFYKYKDAVFSYQPDNQISLNAILADKAGVFAAMTGVLSAHGANIVTLTQGLPSDGVASVSLTICTDHISVPIEQLLELLADTEGVISVRTV